MKLSRHRRRSCCGILFAVSPRLMLTSRRQVAPRQLPPLLPPCVVNSAGMQRLAHLWLHDYATVHNYHSASEKLMKCRRGGRGAGGEGGGSYIKRNEDFPDILAVSCVIFLILLFHLPNGKSSPIWQAASIINNNCRVFIYKLIEELSGKSKVNGLICPYVLFCIGLILSHYR